MPDVPDGSRTVFDALMQALHDAGTYNRNDQAAPAAVLWTDEDRQWEPLLPRLRGQLPLLTLGPYISAERSGPAYWLRCMLAGTLPEDRLPEGKTPVIYLPGFSRQDLRAIEECPKPLRPLAELQYRGVLWSQKNGRDWTIPAFLQSADAGLGIEVGADGATREAAQRALLRLADEPVDRLRRQAPLRAAFFDLLLNPDEIRSLLHWLSDPAGFRARCSAAEWEALRAVCRSKYEFDPQKDGELTAARGFAEQDGAWAAVWGRYRESPRLYPGIESLLRRARPTQLTLFERTSAWPQDNETAESALREKLRDCSQRDTATARGIVEALDREHGERRSWVWSELGEAPLAAALEHLVALAGATRQGLNGATALDLASDYTERGWRADAAVLDALAAVERAEDLQAVSGVITVLYYAWLDDAAQAFQRAVATGGYQVKPIDAPTKGTCLLFSDGLRFDLAQRLALALSGQDCDCGLGWRFAALPTVTATAKPAVSPVASDFAAGSDFSAAVKGSETDVTADVLRRQLSASGYQVLRGEDTGDPSGRGWTELGDIDECGHQQGRMIAHRIAGELRSLSRRIVALLDAGWAQVVVVTDHGWLMLPEGLPKVDLPERLTDIRKGRCARLKPASTTDERTVPWYWDSTIRIAVAQGVRCYEAGKQYEHDGVSPQECVVPVLRVSRPQTLSRQIQISEPQWRGLRCSVTLTGAGDGLMADLRTKAADASSSLVERPKAVDAAGTVSLLVADEERAGDAAFLVVLDSRGTILAQVLTTVGG